MAIHDSVTDFRMRYLFCQHLNPFTIPKCVTTIWGRVFHNYTSLKHLTVPKHVEKIDEIGLGCCEQLETIITEDTSEKNRIASMLSKKHAVKVVTQDEFDNPFE